MSVAKMRCVALAGLLGSALIAGCSDATTTARPSESRARRAVSGSNLDVSGPAASLNRTGAASRSLSAADLSALPSLAGVKIAYDMSHNLSGRQGTTSPTGANVNSHIFADYVSRGATVDVITSFTAEDLSAYNVLWLEEDWNAALSSDEKTALADFVSAGGGVMIVGDEWSLYSEDYGSPLTVFGFGYTPSTLEGSTTRITEHRATQGVSSVYFGGAVATLTSPSEATNLVFDPSGELIGVAVRSSGAGKVVLISDELCYDGNVNGGDNERLCNNLLTFAADRNEGETTQIVPRGEEATVTVKENGEPVAGIKFPKGTFNEEVEVTVRFEKLENGEKCHEYLMGQIGRCLEVSARRTSDGQKAQLHQNVVIGLCLAPAEQPQLEFYKFEDRKGRAIPLQQVFVDFVECHEFTYGSAAPRRGLEGFALGLAKRIGKWITPKSAYAADRGFGGEVHSEDGLSFFSWAAPIKMGPAGLVVNALNSGKDVYAFKGTFDLKGKDFGLEFLGEDGFRPADQEVTVAYGKKVQTIPVNSFRYSSILQRYVYVGRAGSTGITGMDVNPLTGAFVIAGVAPTEGATPPSTYRPFTVQVGHRIQGVALLCRTNGQCVPQHQQ
jgi:hypothetical protein